MGGARKLEEMLGAGDGAGGGMSGSQAPAPAADDALAPPPPPPPPSADLGAGRPLKARRRDGGAAAEALGLASSGLNDATGQARMPYEAIAGWRLCARGFGKECPCCSMEDAKEPPKLQRPSAIPPPGPPRKGPPAEHWERAQAAAAAYDAEAKAARPARLRRGSGGKAAGAQLPGGADSAAGGADSDYAFVDTHCHLEEILQVVRRHNVAPSLSKGYAALTPEELVHWRTLGWAKDPEPEPEEGEEPQGPPPAEVDNPVWEKRWNELRPEERQAAEGLGYQAASWNADKWILPRMRWKDLSEATRQHLTVLGESVATWDDWKSGVATAGAAGPSTVFDSNDLRSWRALSYAERDAARALGFSEKTWNSEEMADVTETIRNLFGAGFEACVTQGCDMDSLEGAAMLAKAHPKVFVSFGCHPKAAWAYNDEFESKLISLAKACGSKTVAWGEFGLDYSHPYFGRIAGNRRKQKEVFARQLEIALAMGYPLVIHSRAADRDTLRMLRGWVPRDWKLHIHSFRGSVQFMEALLEEFKNAYIGIPGIVTMTDQDAHELCRRCPLERLVLETDGPYLPVMGHYLSHPGLMPEVVRKVAELKGRPLGEVFAMVRENAHAIYGI